MTDKELDIQVDKILNVLPISEGFVIRQYIYDLSDNLKQHEISNYTEQIVDRFNLFEYIISDLSSDKLSEQGKLVKRNGGHLKYQNSLNKKDKLEIINLKLQNDSFEYQKSIRTMEAQIRKLTTDNLRLENWDIRFRWYIALGTFVLGIITKYLIEK